MNIICKIFGHSPPVYAKKGWYSPGEEYGKMRNFIQDGIGTVHAEIYAECARCEKEFKVARVHVPINKIPRYFDCFKTLDNNTNM